MGSFAPVAVSMRQLDDVKPTNGDLRASIETASFGQNPLHAIEIASKSFSPLREVANGQQTPPKKRIPSSAWFQLHVLL